MRHLLTIRLCLALMILCGFFNRQSLAQCGSLKLQSNSKSLCQPALFKWVVLDVPKGSNLLWDYGNGESVGLDTFYSFIQNAGKVSLKVQVVLPDKSVCKLSEPNFVEVYPKPVPAVAFSRNKLCDGPDTVSYFDLTPNSNKRNWVIDGTNYYNATKKQIHSYASAGLKRLSIVVEDINGCKAIKEYDSIAIIYKDVNLNFEADQTSGCITKKVKFTPSIESHGLKLISYKWTFPGATQNTQFVEKPDTVLFNAVGKYSPSLAVLTEFGCLHTLTRQNYLSWGAIDSLNIKFSDTSVCKGQTLIVENLKKTLPGDFTWKLNGSSVVIKSDQYTCKARYDTLGKYDVSVNYNYNGCSVSKVFPKAIRVKGVKADFSSPDYYHCLFPHKVHFTNLSTKYEQGKMSYLWAYYFNNQVVRVSANVNDSFTVTKNGHWDVVLVAKHSNGCTDTIRQQSFIRNIPIAPFFASDYQVGCVNQNIFFSQKTPPSSYKAPDQFTWTFFDKDGKKILGKSKAYAPAFSYKDTGLYTVKMIADNGIGCKDSIIRQNYIEIIKPTIKFNLSQPVICQYESLLGEGKSEPKRAKFNYTWSFQNYNSGNKYEVKDSFLKLRMDEAGAYKFKFVHEINNGCRDSIVNNNLIKINGIAVNLALDTFNGCVPLKVNPKVTGIYNFHFNNPDDAIQYYWSASPANGVLITNSNSDKPQFLFQSKGEYTIHLRAINSSGCEYSVNSQTIYVGVEARLWVSDPVVCAGQSIVLTNQSILRPTKSKWLLPSEATLVGSATEQRVEIVFKDDANHKVGLAVNKLDQCFDTVYQNLKSIIVKADFVSLDKELKCAPVYAQFMSYSKYADSLFWNFGDSNLVTTTDPFVANIYRKNTGSKNGLDVSLIAKSNEGCSDTLVKYNYIHVEGPVPNLEILNNEGCEPLKVSFKAKSTDAFKHYINYDDGSPLDSSFASYTYSVISKNLMVQNYTPRLYAIDSLGCKAVFESPIPVIVKRNSKADFSLSDSVFCANESLLVNDLSKDVIQSDFYLQRPGNSQELLKSNTVNFSIKGIHKLSQIVFNLNNCSDTLQKTVLVNAIPSANVCVMDTVCMGKPVRMIDRSTSEWQLVSKLWEVYNPTQLFKGEGNMLVYNFNNFGTAKLILTVTDMNGCSHAKILDINVPNPSDIPGAELKYVSLNEDSSITIRTESNTYYRFASKNIYDKEDLKPISTLGSRYEETIQYTKPLSFDKAQCFDASMNDICGFESKHGASHCSVFLKVFGSTPFVNNLSWSAYQGWSKIDRYQIYRKKEGQSDYELLAEVGNSQLNYTDSGLCNFVYCYFVSAINNDLNSNSNRVSRKPVFLYPPVSKDIQNVTVAGQNQIGVKWEASTNTNFEGFILYKTEIPTLRSEQIRINQNEYLDTKVESDKYSYLYKIVETDHCGYKSSSRLPGKSILLNASTANYKTDLKWNSYQSWASGVKGYALQIEDKGIFRTIFETDYDSSFIHRQSDENIHQAYCYRVMAISGDHKDTSYSNITCVTSPSKVLMPNAFTPNGNGLNEKIGVRTLFVYNQSLLTGRNFTLEIFNRWGEKVYFSQNIDEEWDGTYGGVPVQEGLYSYKLKAMGVDNKGYSLNGVITLLK